jgi:hypothetical protein
MINKISHLLFLLFFLVSNLLSQSKGGRWQFENNSSDTAEWDLIGDTGHLIGDAHFSDEAPLAEGNAYLCLDSLNAHDFFKVDDSNDLDFENENIGISAWIKPLVTNDVHYIVIKGAQDTNPKTMNYAIRISTSKTLEFVINEASGQARKVTSTFTLSAGEWHFIAVYYDYTNKVVYMWNEMKSTPEDTLSFDQDFIANDDPLAIGTWYRYDSISPSIKDFEGSIDDVRISERLDDILPVISDINMFSVPVFNASQESVDIFPNPASIGSGNGHIQFRIASAAMNPLRYTIYNVLGQRVFEGRSGNPAGVKNIQWGLKDNSGNQIRTGIYFVEFKGLQKRVVKKFLILK